MFPYTRPHAPPLHQALTTTSTTTDIATQIGPQPPTLLKMTNSQTEETASLQSRIWRLVHHVQRSPGLPSQVVAKIVSDLRDLSMEFNESTTKLTDERQQAVNEQESLRYDLEGKQRLVQNALAERDRACAERDQAIRDRDLLRSQLDNIHYRQRQTDNRIAEIESKHEATIRELQQKIQHQEEQLSAKRSLWIENHPSSSMRRSGGPSSRDIYGTPTPHGGASRNGPSPPSTGVRPTNLTAQFEKMAAAHPSQPGSSSKVRTHGSVTPPEEESQAVVPFKTLEQTAGEFRGIFNDIFDMVEKWAFTYTRQVPGLSYDQKLSHGQDYWAFLMKCAFLQKATVQEAHSHTILLLRDEQTRPWFVMRVFIQYLIEDILAATNWLKFKPEFDDELKRIDARLGERGLSVQERSDLVTKRSNIVYAIINDNEAFPAYRTFFLGAHTAKLRSRLGPLLDVGVQRADAGRDIGSIVVKAYDLSAKMYCSYKTFVTFFPDCGVRFLDSSMVCRDPQIPEDNTLALQIQQMRVKVAMSPVITIRDDRVRSIEVKGVQEAHVITMK